MNRLIMCTGAAVLLLSAGCGAQGSEAPGGMATRPVAVSVSADAFVRLIQGSMNLGPVSRTLPVSFLLLLRDPAAAQQAAQVAASYLNAYTKSSTCRR